MERITSEVIAEKEFTIASRGYNQEEVDTFLDLICEEMDRLNNEIQDLRQKTTTATVKEETIRKAREDAEAIRLKAETEANERLNGLAEEREGLEKEVTALKETAVEYRRQFEELLHAQQEALEKATGLF